MVIGGENCREPWRTSSLLNQPIMWLGPQRLKGSGSEERHTTHCTHRLYAMCIRQDLCKEAGRHDKRIRERATCARDDIIQEHSSSGAGNWWDVENQFAPEYFDFSID